MWTLLALVAIAQAQPAFEARTLGGEVIAGPLVDVGPKQITIQSAQGSVAIDVGRITGLSAVQVPPSPAARPSLWVRLADGSEVVAADYTATGDRAKIATFDGHVLEPPLVGIAAVRFQPQKDAVAGQWKALLEARPAGDLLVVRVGNALDSHRGVIADVGDDVVRFELDGEVLPVRRAKVHGLIYYRPAMDGADDAACRIVDVDGSRWAARSLVMRDGDLHWTTMSGVEVTRPAADVIRVDFSQGKVVYLSDVKPESSEWTPYFGADADLEILRSLFAPREDRSLRSGPLQLDGTTYAKGLAMHSRTTLEYRLPGAFRRFQALVGIDDRARPRGNARLVIRGDGRVLFDATVAGTDPPKPLDLDISGVRRLSILVDFGEDLDVADDVDLCDARLVK